GRRVFLSAPPSTVAIESGDLGPPRPRLHSVRSPALSGHMAGSPIRSPCSEQVTVTNPSGLDRLPYLAPLVANSLKSKASEVTAVRPSRRSTPVTTTRGCRPLIRRNDGLVPRERWIMDKDTTIGRRPGGAERPHESGAAAPGRGGRMSRQRKTTSVLRLLRGEDLEEVSRSLGVTAATLAGWRDAFVAAGEAVLTT